MITFEHSGSFNHTENFLNSMKQLLFIEISVLRAYAQEGVNALASATPVDTKLASLSWGYEISQSKAGCTIIWTNSDIENGFPVAIMLQYGYGTGTGGYVQGRDYINPAIKPIFDKIADKVWKAVTAA